VKNKFVAIKFALALGIACTLAAAQAPSTTQHTPTTTPHTTHAPVTHAAPTYDHALLTPALLKLKAPESYQVRFVTTKGIFVITVTRAWAPNGADRFYNLVKHRYFDGASFFRALKGFVVQFGLSAYPDVNKVWANANIADDPVKQSNGAGYLTFATAGPNTRTTQLFINLADNSRLDSMGFSAFGQVTEGMDIVNQLYTGYGEGAPDGNGPSQDDVASKGRAFLDKNYPLLDSIKTATIVVVPAAGAPKPAAKPAPKPATKPTGPAF
jgi:peptidyl-prolyl cis-trans isomerase A (cyclophilin A)